MTKQFIISLSVAISILFSGMFSPKASDGCFLPGFLPSLALGGEERGSASVQVISSDECSFGLFIFEWLEKIF